MSHDWEECVHRCEERRRRRRYRQQREEDDASSSSARGSSKVSPTASNGDDEGNIPEAWAMDLTRSYTDLKEEYTRRRRERGNDSGWVNEDDDDDDNDDSNDDDSMTTLRPHDDDDDEFYNAEEDPKLVLFRHLLREWFAGGDRNAVTIGDIIDDDGIWRSPGKWPWNRKKWSPDESGYYENGHVRQVPLMRFPSQIQNQNGPSVRDVIRREFRAPSADVRMKTTEEAGSLKTSDGSVIGLSSTQYPPSSYIDDDVRVQTAFYALMELNRKLAWAERMGFPAPTTTSSNDQIQRSRKRLIQAAKGVYPLPTISLGNDAILSSIKTHARRVGPATTTGHRRRRRRQFSPTLSPMIEREVASDGTDINDVSSDNNNDDNDNNSNSNHRDDVSPLKCGNYLVAHPLMTGYFARSVIVLLDHTLESTDTSSDEQKGGTYGLIVNRLALQPETVDTTRRKLELLRHNWEEGKKKAKLENRGGVDSSGTLVSSSVHLDNNNESSQSTTTQGGEGSREIPFASTNTDARHSSISRSISLLQAINADDLPESVQMAFGDVPIREGGPVNLSLQMIHRRVASNKVTDDDDDYVESDEAIAHADRVGQKKELSSKIGGTMLGYEDGSKRKKDGSGDAIYFGGDVMEASYAVLEGSGDIDDFSFVIGAACWAPGQLEHEIEKGCWLPFAGPATMALTGMCDHNDDIPAVENDNGNGGSKLSQFPPRPSNHANKAEFRRPSQQHVTRPVGDLWLSVMCALGENEADLAFMMLDQKCIKDELGDACDNFDR